MEDNFSMEVGRGKVVLISPTVHLLLCTQVPNRHEPVRVGDPGLTLFPKR